VSALKNVNRQTDFQETWYEVCELGEQHRHTCLLPAVINNMADELYVIHTVHFLAFNILTKKPIN
jgi:hypothetical protein